MNIFRISVAFTSFISFFLMLLSLPSSSVIAQDILEQVIDSNDIQDMYELGENDIYRRLGRPVGRLYLRYKSSFFQRKKLAGSCTASVIADDLILTNYHCITGENGKLRLKKATLWLGYLERDSIEGVVAYDINPVPVEGKRNEKVDYAILRVRPKKGQSSVGLVRQWGKITLNSFVPKRHISLFVIHHPKGLPQKLTTGRCQTVSQITKKGNLLYSCDTIDGSSGSPVFDNNSREVIALHFGAEGQSGDDKEKKYNTGNLINTLVTVSPILKRIIKQRKTQPVISTNASKSKMQDIAQNGMERQAETFVKKLKIFIQDENKVYEDFIPTPKKYRNKDQDINTVGMLTGSRTGTYSIVGAEISDIMGEGSPITLIKSGGSKDTIKKIFGKGNAGLGLVQNDMLTYLPSNLENKKKRPEIRLVMPLYNEYIHILTHAGIDNIGDLHGKKVYIGKPSSGTNWTMGKILEASSVEPSSNGDVTNFYDAIKKLLLGKIDAFAYISGKQSPFMKGINTLIGNPEYQTLFSGIKLLDLRPPQYAKFYKKAVLPQDIYPHLIQNTTLKTLSIKALLVSYDWKTTPKSKNKKTKYKHKIRCQQIRNIVRAINHKSDALRKEKNPVWKEVNFKNISIKFSNKHPKKWNGWKYSDCLFGTKSSQQKTNGWFPF